MSLLVNHGTKPLPAGARPGPEVQAFHRRLPGYAPTPLHDMPALAEAAGVGRVLVKDESSRMGLPAFKILGASWATYRVLCDRDLVISDPSWPGYEDPPRSVIAGYATIFAELEAQLGGAGGAVLDLAMVPLGVGALGASAAACLKGGLEPGEGPVLVGVEPESAACVAAAVEAGHVIEVPGPHRSIMAGLNCGLASQLALPTVAAGFDAFPVPSNATVLLVATEGVTDPVNFERIVGRPPR